MYAKETLLILKVCAYSSTSPAGQVTAITMPMANILQPYLCFTGLSPLSWLLAFFASPLDFLDNRGSHQQQAHNKDWEFRESNGQLAPAKKRHWGKLRSPARRAPSLVAGGHSSLVLKASHHIYILFTLCCKVKKNVCTRLLFPLHSVCQETINPTFIWENCCKWKLTKPSIFIIRATSCPGIPGGFLRGKGESLCLQRASSRSITALKTFKPQTSISSDTLGSDLP